MAQFASASEANCVIQVTPSPIQLGGWESPFFKWSRLFRSSVVVGIVVAGPLSALGSSLGVNLGVRSDGAVSNSSATIINGNVGYAVGLTGQVDVVSGISIRLGATLTQRTYIYQFGGPSSLQQESFTAADIPLGLQWNFTQFWGVFGGANFAINLASSCPAGCAVPAVNTGYQIGTQVRLGNQWAIAALYEAMNSFGNYIDAPKAGIVQGILIF